MIELVYDAGRRRTFLAVFSAGRWTLQDRVTTSGGITLVPFSPENNLIANDAVLLASEPCIYGSEDELVSEIQAFIHRYVDLSPTFEKIATHYVILTWLHDAVNELPYLRLRGDFGSGKTRALLTIGSLCYKAFFASGASTVSPIFHTLNAFRGTLILDEADFRFSDEKAELVKILNNGNVKGMPVLRTVINRSHEFDPRAFHVFGPKIVAMRGSYSDPALESRFLTEVMGSTPLRGDIPINLTDDLREKARALRNKLLLFRFRNWGAAHIRSDAMVGAAPRVRQILSPLLSIVDAEDARTSILDAAALAHGALVAERGLSTEAQLLEVVRALANSGEAALPIGAIADRFRTLHGAEYDHPI